jgi:ubiquinone/menaquinone biosynthesis C-methylase UbiE
VPIEDRAGAWQERARAFGSVAAEYAALRPTYPAETVAFLVGGSAEQPSPPRRILDVGAGTGLLTELLVADGHEVVAVDPAQAMLEQLALRLPQVVTAVAPAEALPLPDGDVDLVAAAQAAHWFDPAPAAAEMARVLRPGGSVGLLWSLRDDRAPWVAALSAILAAENVERFRPHGVADAFARELGFAVETTESVFVQEATPEDVVAGFGTRSYAAAMTDERRAAFLDEIRELISTHPDTREREVVGLPHVVSAFRLSPRRA